MLYKNILLSLNGDENEKTVVDEALRVAKELNSKIKIFHVNDPSAGKMSMMMNSMPRVDAEDIVKLFEKFGYADEVKQMEIQIFESEHYAREIVKETVEADLLVMGHHPKNSVLAIFKDSTDERVADQIMCPMLVVPIK